MVGSWLSAKAHQRLAINYVIEDSEIDLTSYGTTVALDSQQLEDLQQPHFPGTDFKWWRRFYLDFFLYKQLTPRQSMMMGGPSSRFDTSTSIQDCAANSLFDAGPDWMDLRSVAWLGFTGVGNLRKIYSESAKNATAALQWILLFANHTTCNYELPPTPRAVPVVHRIIQGCLQSSTVLIPASIHPNYRAYVLLATGPNQHSTSLSPQKLSSRNGLCNFARKNALPLLYVRARKPASLPLALPFRPASRRNL